MQIAVGKIDDDDYSKTLRSFKSLGKSIVFLADKHLSFMKVLPH